jgi:hypothetical protein
MSTRPERVVVVAVLLLVAAPALADDVEALLRGIDTVPPPERVEALSAESVRALLAIANDEGAVQVRRVRALRLAAGAAGRGRADVDDTIERWLGARERELRVQAAWAAHGRAVREGRGLQTAVSLLRAGDPALREVGAIALAREGTPVGRRHLTAQLEQETDADVKTVLRARLARWPRASTRPAASLEPPAPPASSGAPASPAGAPAPGSPRPRRR